MALGFGSSLGVAASDRIVSAAEALPAQLSFHGWSNRNGEGGGNQGRLFDRGPNSFILLNNNINLANTYALGNVGANPYWAWTRPSVGVWAPTGFSVDTTDLSNDPVVWQSGSRLSVGSGLTQVGTNAAYVVTSTTWCVGNRADGLRNWDGSLAEFAMWNVILSDAEFFALQMGASPDLIRPKARIHYLPLERDGWLNKSGPRWAVTGTKSPLPHPAIAQPASILRIFAVAGGSAHNLVGATSAEANTSSAGAITQSHVLAGANSAQANVSGTGAVTQDGDFIGAPSDQANTSSTAVVTQVHALSGAGSAQANDSATGVISLGAVHNLTAAASTQANSGSSAVITQIHVLVHAPSVQDNVASASAIVQAHILAAANGSQANTGSSGAIVLGDVTLSSVVERTARFQSVKSVSVKFN